jgi:hypothetical protein
VTTLIRRLRYRGRRRGTFALSLPPAADPWADSPLWGVTGPYDRPLYSPTVPLPVVIRKD